MILCLAYVGCEKEYGEQPMGFMRLVNAYEKGAVFLSAETGGLASVINFTDGSSLRIDDFEIHDYRYKEIPEVYYQEKKWYVDGEETEAPYTPKLATVRSHPVFVCYDKTTLYAWASNGKLLKFKSIANLQNIPVVRITTDGGAPIPDKVNYVPGTVTIEDPEEIYSKVSSFSARMGIRGRGNSSWREAKKPWKIKLDEQAKLLGMPADRDWCLLTNFVDVTGLRNLVAMRISEICGFSWTPKMRNVEVYLNDVYQGIYTLSEHKEVNGHKVNITPAGPGDNEGVSVTGDYYMEINGWFDSPVQWETRYHVPMAFKDPETPTPAQINYMKQYVSDFESALTASYSADPQRGYAAYFDVESMMAFFIVQELTKNLDGDFRKSCFVTKERGGKLEMYHVWDFDLSLGNNNMYSSGVYGENPEGWWIKDYDSRMDRADNWFNLMLRDPAFVSSFKKKWNQIRPELKDVGKFIDEQALMLGKAQERNLRLWPVNMLPGWLGYSPKGSYEAELAHLKEFYLKRLEWMDKEIQNW